MIVALTKPATNLSTQTANARAKQKPLSKPVSQSWPSRRPCSRFWSSPASFAFLSQLSAVAVGLRLAASAFFAQPAPNGKAPWLYSSGTASLVYSSVRVSSSSQTILASSSFLPQLFRVNKVVNCAPTSARVAGQQKDHS